MTAWRTLFRWIRSSEVSKRAIVRSLLVATVAQLASNALTIGAPLLLCIAWTQQHWSNPLQRIAIPLVVIELLAFFRSPLLYLDRMNAHRLGFAAVTKWRVWLTRRVATWSVRTTANTSRGELLQQSIQDVDHLQDLWLRVTVPLASSLASFLITLSVMAFLLGRQPVAVTRELSYVIVLALVTTVVVALLASQLHRAASTVNELRRAPHGGWASGSERFKAQIAEISARRAGPLPKGRKPAGVSRG